MSITYFKDRDIDFDKCVDVYRCLNRKGHTFSIRQNGYVVAHTTDISLLEVVFHVNYSGKVRANKTMQRNVHAYLTGKINTSVVAPLDIRITYNPFNDMGFHVKGTNCVLSEVKMVNINDKGVFI